MRDSEITSLWPGGVNSLLHPAAIGKGQYYWGENVVCRGGIIQTRPGWLLRASVLGERLQGFAIFTPRNSQARLVVAVDGKIYFAEFPAYEFRQLAGVAFDPQAEFVVFQNATRSVERLPDGRLRTITPTPVLMMQDGTTRAAYWDGSTAQHLNPAAPRLGTPIGLWMAWSGSRLWVAKGNRIYAGDILDPTTASETVYLAERSAFDLPGDCTGLIETANQTGLLAFTQKTTTAFQSYIRERADWPLTKDFQKVIIPGIGNIAPRAAVNQYGKTYIFSEAGYVSLDAALHAQQSSRLVTEDNPMARSKRLLSPRPLPACAVAFENYLLLSVPAGDKYNAQTWACDQSPIDGQPPAWCGIWTGARPAQWATGRVGGRDRCYFAAFDKNSFGDTHIHIWEAFQPGREDEGGAITCQMETAMMNFGDFVQFKFAEIEVCELLGDANLKVYVGGARGGWTEIADFDMQAEIGSIGSSMQLELTTESLLQAFKPQSRLKRTRELTPAEISCMAEQGGDPKGSDYYFQLLLEWRGRMGIRQVEWFLSEAKKTGKGKCETSEAGQHNAVNAEGEKVT